MQNYENSKFVSNGTSQTGCCSSTHNNERALVLQDGNGNHCR